jgi:hypothetical protein
MQATGKLLLSQVTSPMRPMPLANMISGGGGVGYTHANFKITSEMF